MILDTPRLLLRPWQARDRTPLAAIMADPLVRRYFPRTLTAAETNALINEAIERAAVEGFHAQAAELKETGELIGLIGLTRFPDITRNAINGRPEVEVEWLLGRHFWGRGLAPEGARAWIEHGWSVGLHEIVAITATVNAPSERVMQKLGMTRYPDDDFDHPLVPAGHPARRHLIYRRFSPA